MNRCVSVVVPVWGAERTLDRCVRSVLGQALGPGDALECILVDDGSPDRCGEICDAYAARDPRVQVVHKEDGGVSSARNAGLRRSRGAYVVFLDSDDALRPGALAAALAAQAAAPGDFVLWHYTDNPNDPAPTGQNAKPAGQSALARLWLDCLIGMPWNKLYRGDLPAGSVSTNRILLAKIYSLYWIIWPCSGRKRPGSVTQWSKAR